MTDADHLRWAAVAFDLAPVGLAVLDGEQRIVHCNARFAHHLGVDPDRLVGRVLSAVSTGHPWPSPARAADDVDEWRIPGEDGVDRWVRLTRTAPTDRMSAETVVASVDVTEQRKALLTLSQFGLLFRHATDVITVVDTAGAILTTSPSHERLLGHPLGFVHPEGIFGLVHPDDHLSLRRALDAVVELPVPAAPMTLRFAVVGGGWRQLETVLVSLLHEPAVRGIVLTARDVTDRELLREELVRRAERDPLTGLLNRAMLEPVLHDALARSGPGGHLVGVCYVDLDGFKGVNDSHGHAAGDELLVRAATSIERSIRSGDVALRVGGDEFVVVLDVVESLDDAVAVSSRVREAIVEDAPRALRTARYGASVGVAVSRPGDGPDSLLRRADVELYRAKAARRPSRWD